MGRKILEEKMTVVDTTSGEVTKELTKTITIKTGQQEEFFMLFIRSLSFVFEINSLPAMKVLIKFCELVTYNTGTILLPSDLRAKVCKDLDMSNNQLSNVIAYLKKQKVLSGKSGVFELNPAIAWKGDLKGRQDAIKKMKVNLFIQYDSNK